MFPFNQNGWYSTTWTVICFNWISAFVREKSVLPQTIPHSCAFSVSQPQEVKCEGSSLTCNQTEQGERRRRRGALLSIMGHGCMSFFVLLYHGIIFNHYWIYGYIWHIWFFHIHMLSLCALFRKWHVDLECVHICVSVFVYDTLAAWVTSAHTWNR